MKCHKVFFGDKKLEELFNNLPEKDPIKKGLIKAIRDIKEDCMIGRLITKETYNKTGIKTILNKYKVENMRIYNLPSAWRMLYSITRNECIEIIAVILDWMDHKEYEKMLK
jgi:hypothetical protein